jgi:hypothetical protein
MSILKKILAEKLAADAKHPGLWANIRAKRARGGKPAKPGSEAYPDKKNWDKLTKKQAGLEGPEEHTPIAGVGPISVKQDPTPAPAPKATPTPTPDQRLIDITKKNQPDMITPPKSKLGMYLEALDKLAAANVVMHKEDKNPSGGLTQHGRDKYNRETGSHLKAPVTGKNPKGEAKARKASFCARMSGVEGPMKDEHGKPTRKALALRKWNCS